MESVLSATFWLVSLGLVAFLLLLSVVIRRFIGTPMSLARLLVAAGLSMGLLYLLQTQVTWRGGQGGLGVVALQFGMLAFFSAVALVVSEILVPSGSIPPVSTWGRALRRVVVHTRRSSQIMGVLMRHGLNPLRAETRTAYQRRPRQQAREVRAALEEAGATFVKLGQMFSTRPDLLPAEYIQELKNLQQNVAPAPWEDIRGVLREELGDDVEAHFSAFEREPLASASIGQVHRARLRGGEPVVVKVQRPGIQEIVEDDLSITMQIGRTLEQRTEWGRTMGTSAIAEGFCDALREEMDYSVEARNIADLRAALQTHPEHERLVVPDYYPDLSTPRVLTMQELQGVTLSDPAALSGLSDEDRREKARRIFHSIWRQITVDGIFHADPHPGNIMILSGRVPAPVEGRAPEEGVPRGGQEPQDQAGQLALLDCGSAGRLDRRLQGGLTSFILAVEYSDPQQLTDALFETLGRPETVDEQELTRVLGRFMVTELRAGGRMRLNVFNELIRIVGLHGLPVPPELGLAFRSIATLEGTLALLDPEFDLIGEARTLATRQIEDEYSPLHLRRNLERELVTVLPILRRLPRHVDQIASAIEDGRLTMRVRVFADRRDRVVLWQVTNQILLATLGSVLGVIAVLLVTSSGGPKFTDAFTLLQLVGYSAGFVSTVLIFRVLLVIFKRDME